MSGLIRSPLLLREGPREEKLATCGYSAPSVEEAGSSVTVAPGVAA